MGFCPPPPPPSREEWRRRYEAGARSFRELDPDFHRWLDARGRFYSIAWPLMIGGAIGLGLAVALLAAR